ncbi:MAG: hypothetical protein ACKVQU_04960 [Burkholderiales bacterium]
MFDGLWVTMQIVAFGFLAWGAWLSLGEVFSDRSTRHAPDREVAGTSQARTGQAAELKKVA